CKRVVDWCHSRGLEFYLESNSGLYASEKFEQAALETMREYSRRKDRPGADSITVRDAFPDMIFGAGLYRDDVNKISYILSSYQDFLDAQSQFPDMKSGTWGGAGETALFGDLGVKDIDKGKAVDALLRHLGASQADTIAFGDAKVDIPMLEYCAVGVAMGSGGEEIRAMADLVTDGVNEDGLYHAFETLRLL
ncbi:MAG: HAD hydrolase family protein, partial [Oscillospiraceae bacterium]|nr:HAD hydrolase family protein [Oscillospiraceae bacterium]